MGRAHHSIWHKGDASPDVVVKLYIHANDLEATAANETSIAATVDCSWGPSAVPLLDHVITRSSIYTLPGLLDCFFSSVSLSFFFIIVKYTSHKIYHFNHSK